MSKEAVRLIVGAVLTTTGVAIGSAGTYLLKDVVPKYVEGKLGKMIFSAIERAATEVTL